jgi:hypothetical protein
MTCQPLRRPTAPSPRVAASTYGPAVQQYAPSLLAALPQALPARKQRTPAWQIGLGLLSACLVGGCVLGLTVPGREDLAAPWSQISSICGWTYFMAWSIR